MQKYTFLNLLMTFLYFFIALRMIVVVQDPVYTCKFVKKNVLLQKLLLKNRK